MNEKVQPVSRVAAILHSHFATLPCLPLHLSERPECYWYGIRIGLVIKRIHRYRLTEVCARSTRRFGILHDYGTNEEMSVINASNNSRGIRNYCLGFRDN